MGSPRMRNNWVFFFFFNNNWNDDNVIPFVKVGGCMQVKTFLAHAYDLWTYFMWSEASSLSYPFKNYLLHHQCMYITFTIKKKCMYITISLYYIRCLTIFRKKKKRKKKSWSILCGVVLTNYSIHILKHKIPFRFLELIIVIVSFQFD